MRRKFTYKKSWFVMCAIATFMSFAFSNAWSYQHADTSYIRFIRPKTTKNPLKTNLHLVLPPVKPAVISTTKLSVARADDKVLSNVSVGPNPVTTDQLNIRYEISRYSNVTIKIMDVLGNDIITLFNQRVDPGERNFTYQLNNKLNHGFYFVRIIAGTESVIKRIAVVN